MGVQEKGDNEVEESIISNSSCPMMLHVFGYELQFLLSGVLSVWYFRNSI